MTRINCVPVQELTQKHLVAEYRELPRTFSLVQKSVDRKEPLGYKSPLEYTLGTGHVRFFYDKLEWLNNRQIALVQEMLNRGYNPTYLEQPKNEWIKIIPVQYWNDWVPSDEAIKINRERILERLKG